jgi:hypothetical protein
MEFKVKEVDANNEKSKREVEKELIEAADKENGTESIIKDEIAKIDLRSEEAKKEEKKEVVEEKKEEPKAELPEIDDEIVLSHIRKRFNKEDVTFDDLFKKEIVKEELPEGVQALLNYTRETGRGVEDYLKLSQDHTKLPEDDRIAEYIKSTNPHFDNEDVRFEMDRQFKADELDEEDEIRIKNLEKKKILAKADKFFEDQKKLYKDPLESREPQISNEDLEFLKQSKENAKLRLEQAEADKKKREHFSSKTNELFSSNFEGFDYKIGDNNVVYKVKDVENTKNTQMDVMNFIAKHRDEEGFIKDVPAYHKALSAAMDPEGMAKYFYDLGAADAISKDIKEAKNPEKKPTGAGTGIVDTKPAVRAVNNDHGNGLKIKSKRKQ